MISLLLTDSVKYKNFEDSLLTKYPETAGANYIRLMRGIEPVAVIEDSAKYFFNIASGKFIDSLYQEAAAEYLDISKKYDKSPLSPKIMQAAALIYENYLKDYDKAAEIYSEIKEKYSQSEYGRFAARKLKKDGEEIRKEVIKEEKVISEADKWYLMDRRND
jgi:tetratricopeptide (TPR) repeat protein